MSPMAATVTESAVCVSDQRGHLSADQKLPEDECQSRDDYILRGNYSFSATTDIWLTI